jgi:hypothetical protein
LPARYGHVEVVLFIIEIDVDVLEGSDRALAVATQNGHLEVVKSFN